MAVIAGRIPGWALDGDGSGSGSGDVERAEPVATVAVTVGDLQRHDACDDACRVFVRTFPNGATFPDDIPKAVSAGLSLQWAQEHLGLIAPRTERVA